MEKRSDIQTIVKMIAGRVRMRRKALGMTQEQLAEKADVSVTYVAKLEAAERTPSLETLVKLADVLGVQVSDLVYLEEPPTAGNQIPGLVYAFEGLDEKDLTFVEEQIIHLVTYLRQRQC